ncbi:MAG TPA: GNAT family N-acetyltransferase [Stellaceae bacterium]|jgi:acetyltransferase
MSRYVAQDTDTRRESRSLSFLPMVVRRRMPRPGVAALWSSARPPTAFAGSVRPLRRRDETLHRAFYTRIHGDDLRLRFGRAVPQVTARELAWLTAAAPGEIVLGAFQRRRLVLTEIVGIGRAVIVPETRSADFAVAVRSDLKRRGIGTALLMRLIEECRTRGIDELIGDVLHENEAMLALARKLGATVDGATRTDYARIRFTFLQAPPAVPPGGKRAAHHWPALVRLRDSR